MIKIDFALFERASCTDDEKRSLFDLVKLIITLSEKTRKEGFLSLDYDIQKINHTFFQKILLLVVDGTATEIIEEIGEVYIYAKQYHGKELLEAMLIFSGVLAIQGGENPRVLEEKLSAFFPDLQKEYYSYIDREYPGFSITQDSALTDYNEYKAIIKQIQKDVALSEYQRKNI